MSGQSWNAQGYQTNAGFVPVLGRPVLELLAPRPGEHILDLGCGDGVLTVELVAAGATVVGIDSSPEMVAAAREKGLDAHVADAAHLSLDGAFDAVFSNAVLHWVKDADGAIASAWRALRPGGRFVGEFGGHGNVAAIVTALFAVLARRGVDAAPFHPWFYPTPQAYPPGGGRLPGRQHRPGAAPHAAAHGHGGLAGDLRQSLPGGPAGGRPRGRTRRDGRAAAPGPVRRPGRLDRRLRPPALRRDPAGLSRLDAPAGGADYTSV